MRIVNRLKTAYNQFLWRRFAHVLKSNPLASFAYRDGEEGGIIARPANPDIVGQAQVKEPWVYVACNVLGRNLSAAPLIVEELRTVNSEAVWEESTENDLSRMITRPNPVEPMDVVLWKTVLSMMIGDAYWIYDPIDNEVYHTHPSFVTRIGEGETPDYEIRRGARTTRVPYDDMMHFAMPSNKNDFYGQSPIEPIAESIDTNYFYRRHMKNFFKRGAVPGGILKTDQGLADGDADKMRKEWERIHGGVDQAYRISILEAGLSYQEVTAPIGELMNETLTKMTREEILAVFGIPPVFAGIFDEANYANSKEQKIFLWENTILPLQRIIVGYLNIQLVPRFGDPERLRLKFDTSEIQALRHDKDAEMKRLRMGTDGGIITVNEAREELGKEPVEGADELRRIQSGGGGNGGGFGSENDDDSKAVIKPVGQINEQRYWQWDMHYKAVLFEEASLSKLFQKYFDGQLDRVIKSVTAITNARKFNIAQLYLAKQDPGDTNLIEIVFDITVEDLILAEVTDPVVRQLIIESARRGMRQVNASAAFNVKNPKVAAMVESFKNRIKDINVTTYKDIQAILVEVYEEGLGLDQAVRQLRAKYKQFSKYRGDRIAKTEMNGLVNGGHVMGYAEAGVAKKEWSAAFLADSRPDHIAADSQPPVLINAKFEVGPDLLDFPGDPGGSPGNVINCYCSVNPVVE